MSKYFEIPAEKSYASYIRKFWLLDNSDNPIITPGKYALPNGCVTIKSGWLLTSKELPGYAKPYYSLSLNFPFYTLVTYPEGGLRTSTNDLSKYLIEIIKGYNGNSRILSGQAFKTMFTPQFTAGNLPDSAQSM